VEECCAKFIIANSPGIGHMKLSATRQVVRHQAYGHHCFSVALSTKLKVQICGRGERKFSGNPKLVETYMQEPKI
jgi:hypothetical protein